MLLKELGKLIAECYRRFGNAQTATVLDKIKKLGFTFATRAGIDPTLTSHARRSRIPALLTEIHLTPYGRNLAAGCSTSSNGLAPEWRSKGTIPPVETVPCADCFCF